ARRIVRRTDSARCRAADAAYVGRAQSRCGIARGALRRTARATRENRVEVVGELHRLDVLHLVYVELRAVFSGTGVEAIEPLLHALEIIGLRSDHNDRIRRFYRHETEHAAERRFGLFAEQLVEFGHDLGDVDVAQAIDAHRHTLEPVDVEYVDRALVILQ